MRKQVKLMLVLCGLLAFAWAVDRFVPPWHLPWKRLDLSHPIGLATRLKLSILAEAPEACRNTLTRSGVSFEAVGDKVVTASCGWTNGTQFSAFGPALKPSTPVTTSCAMLAGLVLWDRQVLQPAARQYFAQGVAVVDHFGSYNCRRLYGRNAGPWSEHAQANAFDIAGFRLTNGQRISVLKDWQGTSDKASFLRQIHDGACRIFSVTLGPEANAAHADHFHVDMGLWQSCR
jgi:hypothetical protein